MFVIYIWIKGYVCFTNSIIEQLFLQIRTDIFTTEFFGGTHVLISPQTVAITTDMPGAPFITLD